MNIPQRFYIHKWASFPSHLHSVWEWSRCSRHMPVSKERRAETTMYQEVPQETSIQNRFMKKYARKGWLYKSRDQLGIASTCPCQAPCWFLSWAPWRWHWLRVLHPQEWTLIKMYILKSIYITYICCWSIYNRLTISKSVLKQFIKTKLFQCFLCNQIHGVSL